ncbi:hypothetical protein J6590_012855 [Homalodisca vitripennis]|nr:hypothetical protein J6590_012855 [Homalodisca vitripennis]
MASEWTVESVTCRLYGARRTGTTHLSESLTSLSPSHPRPDSCHHPSHPPTPRRSSEISKSR